MNNKQKPKPSEPIPVPEPAPARAARLGDVVHYVSQGNSIDVAQAAHRAAIVTGLTPTGVMLHVFNPFRPYDLPLVEQDDSGAPGTWHFPE